MRKVAFTLTAFVWLPFLFSFALRSGGFGLSDGFEQSQHKLVAAIVLSAFIWCVFGVLRLFVPDTHLSKPPSPTIKARIAEAGRIMDLCDCTVEDITTAFVRANVNDFVDPEEGLAFAMALATELYSLGQGSAAKAKPALDDFHLTTEAQLSERLTTLDKKSLDACVESFYTLLRVRYPQYRQAIRSQVFSSHPSWFPLSQLVLENLFGDRLSLDQRQTLLVPLATQLGLTILSGLNLVAPNLPSFSIPPMVFREKQS